VQPVLAYGGVPRVKCRWRGSLPDVTPNGAPGCTALGLIAPAPLGRGRTFLVPRAPKAAPRPRGMTVPRERGRRMPPVAVPAPAPPPVFVAPPCAAGSALPFVVPKPGVAPRAVPVPLPARPAPPAVGPPAARPAPPAIGPPRKPGP
jgi:hypothetical protein